MVNKNATFMIAFQGKSSYNKFEFIWCEREEKMKQVLSDYSTQDKKLFVGSYYAFFVNGMLALSVGALLPYIREQYGLDYAVAGFLLSLFSVGNLISSGVAGVVSLGIGLRKSATLFSLCSIVAFFGMSFTSNASLLGIFFLLAGLSRGSSSYTNNTIINNIATGKAWALNMLHGVFAIGAFCSPFLMLWCATSKQEGWRLGALILGVFCTTQMLTYLLLKMPAVQKKTQETQHKTKTWSFLGDKAFLTACGIMFFYMCTEQGINGWCVTYFKDSGIMTEAFAQSMASILWLFILAGRLFCAALSSKVAKHKLLVFSVVGYAVFLGITLSARSLAPAAIGVIGLGFFMAGIYPTTVADVGQPLKKYPLAMPTLLVIAGIGATIMPSIIGSVAQKVGIIGGMSTLLAAAVITAAFIFWNAWQKRKTDKEV